MADEKGWDQGSEREPGATPLPGGGGGFGSGGEHRSDPNDPERWYRHAGIGGGDLGGKFLDPPRRERSDEDAEPDVDDAERR
jgi:hypothetical protein